MSFAPKRILVVGMTDNPGGIEAMIRSVIASTDPTVIRFDFLANVEKLAYEDELKAYGARIYHITARRVNRARFYRELDAVLEEHAREYIAIWENMNSLANIDYLIHAKRFGIPYRIMHCHNGNNTEGFVRGVLHAANRLRVRKYATHYWSASDDASRWFFGDDFRSLPNYRVVNNTIDVNHFAFDQQTREQVRASFGIQGSSLVLGNVGRMHPQKKQRFILDVVSELRKIGRDARALIIGEGKLRDSLETHASELGISDFVYMPGAVEDSAPYYNAMDVFVFPSEVEGLGIVLLEAEANGLPAVISDRVPRDAVLNSNVKTLPLEAPALEWASLAQQIADAGRTSELKVKGSRFDSSRQQHLFDEFISEP